MSCGDAYIYAIILKNENVEKVYELERKCDAINEVIYGWLDELKECNKLKHPIAYYIGKQLKNEMEKELYLLTHDNIDMIYLIDDSSHNSYDNISRYILKGVDEFLNDDSDCIYNSVFKKLKKYSGYYIWFSHVHMDDFYDWEDKFAVKEKDEEKDEKLLTEFILVSGSNGFPYSVVAQVFTMEDAKWVQKKLDYRGTNTEIYQKIMKE